MRRYMRLLFYPCSCKNINADVLYRQDFGNLPHPFATPEIYFLLDTLEQKFYNRTILILNKNKVSCIIETH